MFAVIDRPSAVLAPEALARQLDFEIVQSSSVPARIRPLQDAWVWWDALSHVASVLQRPFSVPVFQQTRTSQEILDQRDIEWRLLPFDTAAHALVCGERIVGWLSASASWQCQKLLQIPEDSADLLPHAAGSDSRSSVVVTPDESGLLHVWALGEEPLHALTSPPPWLPLLGPGPCVALAQAFCRRSQGTHKGLIIAVTHDGTLWHGELSWSPQPQQPDRATVRASSAPQQTHAASALAARVAWQGPLDLSQLGLRNISGASMLQDDSTQTVYVTVAGRGGSQTSPTARVATVKVQRVGSGHVLSSLGAGNVAVPGSVSSRCDLAEPVAMRSLAESGPAAPNAASTELLTGSASYRGAPNCNDVLKCQCSALSRHARQHGRQCRRAAGARDPGGEDMLVFLRGNPYDYSICACLTASGHMLLVEMASGGVVGHLPPPETDAWREVSFMPNHQMLCLAQSGRVLVLAKDDSGTWISPAVQGCADNGVAMGVWNASGDGSAAFNIAAPMSAVVLPGSRQSAKSADIRILFLRKDIASCKVPYKWTDDASSDGRSRALASSMAPVQAAEPSPLHAAMDASLQEMSSKKAAHGGQLFYSRCFSVQVMCPVSAGQHCWQLTSALCEDVANGLFTAPKLVQLYTQATVEQLSACAMVLEVLVAAAGWTGDVNFASTALLAAGASAQDFAQVFEACINLAEQRQDTNLMQAACAVAARSVFSECRGVLRIWQLALQHMSPATAAELLQQRLHALLIIEAAIPMVHLSPELVHQVTVDGVSCLLQSAALCGDLQTVQLLLAAAPGHVKDRKSALSMCLQEAPVDLILALLPAPPQLLQAAAAAPNTLRPPSTLPVEPRSPVTPPRGLKLNANSPLHVSKPHVGPPSGTMKPPPSTLLASGLSPIKLSTPPKRVSEKLIAPHWKFTQEGSHWITASIDDPDQGAKRSASHVLADACEEADFVFQLLHRIGRTSTALKMLRVFLSCVPARHGSLPAVQELEDQLNQLEEFAAIAGEASAASAAGGSALSMDQWAALDIHGKLQVLMKGGSHGDIGKHMVHRIVPLLKQTSSAPPSHSSSIEPWQAAAAEWVLQLDEQPALEACLSILRCACELREESPFSSLPVEFLSVRFALHTAQQVMAVSAGSTPQTWQLVHELCASAPHIGRLHLYVNEAEPTSEADLACLVSHIASVGAVSEQLLILADICNQPRLYISPSSVSALLSKAVSVRDACNWEGVLVQCLSSHTPGLHISPSSGPIADDHSLASGMEDLHSLISSSFKAACRVPVAASNPLATWEAVQELLLLLDLRQCLPTAVQYYFDCLADALVRGIQFEGAVQETTKGEVALLSAAYAKPGSGGHTAWFPVYHLLAQRTLLATVSSLLEQSHSANSVEVHLASLIMEEFNEDHASREWHEKVLSPDKMNIAFEEQQRVDSEWADEKAFVSSLSMIGDFCDSALRAGYGSSASGDAVPVHSLKRAQSIADQDIPTSVSAIHGILAAYPLSFRLVRDDVSGELVDESVSTQFGELQKYRLEALQGNGDQQAYFFLQELLGDCSGDLDDDVARAFVKASESAGSIQQVAKLDSCCTAEQLLSVAWQLNVSRGSEDLVIIILMIFAAAARAGQFEHAACAAHSLLSAARSTHSASITALTVYVLSIFVGDSAESTEKHQLRLLCGHWVDFFPELTTSSQRWPPAARTHTLACLLQIDVGHLAEPAQQHVSSVQRHAGYLLRAASASRLATVVGCKVQPWLAASNLNDCVAELPERSSAWLVASAVSSKAAFRALGGMAHAHENAMDCIRTACLTAAVLLQQSTPSCSPSHAVEAHVLANTGLISARLISPDSARAFESLFGDRIQQPEAAVLQCCTSAASASIEALLEANGNKQSSNILQEGADRFLARVSALSGVGKATSDFSRVINVLTACETVVRKTIPKLWAPSSPSEGSPPTVLDNAYAQKCAVWHILQSCGQLSIAAVQDLWVPPSHDMQANTFHSIGSIIKTLALERVGVEDVVCRVALELCAEAHPESPCREVLNSNLAASTKGRSIHNFCMNILRLVEHTDAQSESHFNVELRHIALLCTAGSQLGDSKQWFAAFDQARPQQNGMLNQQFSRVVEAIQCARSLVGQQSVLGIVGIQVAGQLLKCATAAGEGTFLGFSLLVQSVLSELVESDELIASRTFSDWFAGINASCFKEWAKACRCINSGVAQAFSALSQVPDVHPPVLTPALIAEVIAAKFIWTAPASKSAGTISLALMKAKKLTPAAVNRMLASMLPGNQAVWIFTGRHATPAPMEFLYNRSHLTAVMDDENVQHCIQRQKQAIMVLQTAFAEDEDLVKVLSLASLWLQCVEGVLQLDEGAPERLLYEVDETVRNRLCDYAGIQKQAALAACLGEVVVSWIAAGGVQSGADAHSVFEPIAGAAGCTDTWYLVEHYITEIVQHLVGTAVKDEQQRRLQELGATLRPLLAAQDAELAHLQQKLVSMVEAATTGSSDLKHQLLHIVSTSATFSDNTRVQLWLDSWMQTFLSASYSHSAAEVSVDLSAYDWRKTALQQLAQLASELPRGCPPEPAGILLQLGSLLLRESVQESTRVTQMSHSEWSLLLDSSACCTAPGPFTAACTLLQVVQSHLVVSARDAVVFLTFLADHAPKNDLLQIQLTRIVEGFRSLRQVNLSSARCLMADFSESDDQVSGQHLSMCLLSAMIHRKNLLSSTSLRQIARDLLLSGDDESGDSAVQGSILWPLGLLSSGHDTRPKSLHPCVATSVVSLCGFIGEGSLAQTSIFARAAATALQDNPTRISLALGICINEMQGSICIELLQILFSTQDGAESIEMALSFVVDDDVVNKLGKLHVLAGDTGGVTHPDGDRSGAVASQPLIADNCRYSQPGLAATSTVPADDWSDDWDGWGDGVDVSVGDVSGAGVSSASSESAVGESIGTASGVSGGDGGVGVEEPAADDAAAAGTAAAATAVTTVTAAAAAAAPVVDGPVSVDGPVDGPVSPSVSVEAGAAAAAAAAAATGSAGVDGGECDVSVDVGDVDETDGGWDGWGDSVNDADHGWSQFAGGRFTQSIYGGPTTTAAPPGILPEALEETVTKGAQEAAAAVTHIASNLSSWFS